MSGRGTTARLTTAAASRSSTPAHRATIRLGLSARSDVLAHHDAWLLRCFDPESLDVTVAALAAAQEPDLGVIARAEAARRAVADCNSRLTKYRAALEGGADPVIVADWIRDVEKARQAAESDLAEITPREQLSTGEIRALVREVGRRDRVPPSGVSRSARSNRGARNRRALGKHLGAGAPARDPIENNPLEQVVAGTPGPRVGGASAHGVAACVRPLLAST